MVEEEHSSTQSHFTIPWTVWASLLFSLFVCVVGLMMGFQYLDSSISKAIQCFAASLTGGAMFFGYLYKIRWVYKLTRWMWFGNFLTEEIKTLDKYFGVVVEGGDPPSN